MGGFSIELAVFALLVGGIFGASLLLKGWVRTRIAFQLWRTPTSEIGAVTGREDVVELHGRVQSHPDCDVLDRPFSDGDCVYRNWVIEKSVTNANGRVVYRTVGEGEDMVPFRVTDGTATVTVNPRTFDTVLLDTVKEPVVVSRTGLPEEYREFVDEHIETDDRSEEERLREELRLPDEAVPNRRERDELIPGLHKLMNPRWPGTDTELKDYRDGVFAGDQRFTENVIRPGDEVYVYGNPARAARNNPDRVILNGDETDDLTVVSDYSLQRLRFQVVTGASRLLYGGVLMATAFGTILSFFFLNPLTEVSVILFMFLVFLGVGILIADWGRRKVKKLYYAFK